jgi:hypothetical protein
MLLKAYFSIFNDLIFKAVFGRFQFEHNYEGFYIFINSNKCIQMIQPPSPIVYAFHPGSKSNSSWKGH